MILYNVTINVDDDIASAWLDYMRRVHIPDVMKTNCFKAYRFSKVLSRGEGESGTTYAVQYHCGTMEDYRRYIDTFANHLRKDIEEKFGGKFHIFRTLLEEIDRGGQA